MTRSIQTLFAAALTLASLSAPAFAGDDADVAIDGYCPVAYVGVGKAVMGSPDHTVQHDGHTWRFVNADAKAAYEKNPAGFEVNYDGWCATAIAFGKKVETDPTVFSVYDGETYLFSNVEAKAMFDEDPAEFVKKADRAWKKLDR